MDLLYPKVKVDAKVSLLGSDLASVDANVGIGWLNDLVGLHGKLPVSPFENFKIGGKWSHNDGKTLNEIEYGGQLKMGVVYAVAAVAIAAFYVAQTGDPQGAWQIIQQYFETIKQGCEALG